MFTISFLLHRHVFFPPLLRVVAVFYRPADNKNGPNKELYDPGDATCVISLQLRLQIKQRVFRQGRLGSSTSRSVVVVSVTDDARVGKHENLPAASVSFALHRVASF